MLEIFAVNVMQVTMESGRHAQVACYTWAVNHGVLLAPRPEEGHNTGADMLGGRNAHN